MFLLSVQFTKAQTIECGTPDMTLAQRDSFLEQIISGTVAGTAVNSPWKIGIWFYHLRYSDGSTNQQNYDPEPFVTTINQYFSGLFEFKICGLTTIDDDDYVELDLGSSHLADLWNDVSALNEPLSDNCIRVFLLGDGPVITGNTGASGVAHDPLTYGGESAVFLAILNAQIWAHELGHYFGLPHTFVDPNTQYVNSPVTINGVEFTCLQTGDGFCDTPADLDNNCSFTSLCEFQFCSPANDPLGVPYAPDPTLLMSYYDECRNRFSAEQKQLMRTLYLYHPAYEAIRNVPAECVAPKYGFIERNCVGYVPDNPTSPLSGLPVSVRDEFQSCTSNNNETDTLGRYFIMPCTLSGVRRHTLPDRNFGNDPLNGVSTIDMAFINRHILGLQPFQNPFQIIAADVNNSASVSTFDIVEIRKLILGFYTQFPIGISWRYVPKLCTDSPTFYSDFSANPFDAEFPDPFSGIVRKYNNPSLTVPISNSWMDHASLLPASSLANNESAWSFTGIKLGDVNCNASVDYSNFTAGETEYEFVVDSGSLATIPQGATKRIQIIASAPTEVVAWQFGVRYASDSLNLSGIMAGSMEEIFDEENFHYAPADSLHESGRLRAIWYSTDGGSVDIDNQVLFEIQATADQAIGSLRDVFKLDHDVLPFLFYDEDGEVIPEVALRLQVSEIPQEIQIEKPPLTHILHARALRVSAYPSPFTTEVTLSVELADADDQPALLRVFDAAGVLVGTKEIVVSAGPQEIRIGELAQQPAGFYWYTLKTGIGFALGKLSKR